MQTTQTGADLELPENEDARRAKIKDVYPVEILCPECHGPVFFYRNLPVRGRQFDPGQAMTMEGVHPTRIRNTLTCPNCSAEVRTGDLRWRGKSW